METRTIMGYHEYAMLSSPTTCSFLDLTFKNFSDPFLKVQNYLKKLQSFDVYSNTTRKYIDVKINYSLDFLVLKRIF